MTNESKEYFNWLASIFDMDDADHSYLVLARRMFEKEFFSIIEMDVNREGDAKALREAYIAAGGVGGRFLEGPANALEVMIAMANRFGSIIISDYEEDPSEKCFWEMMENIGLAPYSDDAIIGDPACTQRIDEILDRWIERRFSRNGKGSPFPLKKPKKDQRKVEMWYQMQGYICENYPLYYEERK